MVMAGRTSGICKTLAVIRVDGHQPRNGHMAQGSGQKPSRVSLSGNLRPARREPGTNPMTEKIEADPDSRRLSELGPRGRRARRRFRVGGRQLVSIRVRRCPAP